MEVKDLQIGGYYNLTVKSSSSDPRNYIFQLISINENMSACYYIMDNHYSRTDNLFGGTDQSPSYYLKAFRHATTQEIAHLNACIKQGKYVNPDCIVNGFENYEIY